MLPRARIAGRRVTMSEGESIQKVHSELQEGMALKKCRKCGCMQEALESLQTALTAPEVGASNDLLTNIGSWLTQMEPNKYSCLGCDYCYPAVAQNILFESYPDLAVDTSLSCSTSEDQTWPPVAGDYFVLCDSDGGSCSVAVSTLASVDLAKTLAERRPEEICIVGKTETENIGVEKVIRNTVTNPSLRTMILAGKESEKHFSGRTLYQVWKEGVDESMRVIGSPGRRPFLKNVTRKEVSAFREQVRMIDLIGCEDVQRIIGTAKDTATEFGTACECGSPKPVKVGNLVATVPTIRAREPSRIEMDKGGYFVILPQHEKRTITVEHYSYDNTLLRNIEGKTARELYLTIVNNGWATQLSHAAYLGKELEKAQLSIELGFKYVQDAA